MYPKPKIQFFLVNSSISFWKCKYFWHYRGWLLLYRSIQIGLFGVNGVMADAMILTEQPSGNYISSLSVACLVLLDQDEPINVSELRRSQLHPVQRSGQSHTHIYRDFGKSWVSSDTAGYVYKRRMANSCRVEPGDTQYILPLVIPARSNTHTCIANRNAHTDTLRLRQEERLCWTSAALSPATSATCRVQSAPDNTHTHT